MLNLLKQGYAQLLDTTIETLTPPGLHFVVTPKRDQPEWANWVHPIWFFKIDNSVVCSVSPSYATRTQAMMAGAVMDTLLADRLLRRAQAITAEQNAVALEWVRCELLYYPDADPPALSTGYPVEPLQPTDERSRAFLRNFDGGVYGIRAADGVMAAHAFIKNKGVLQEIAVGTEPAYQRRGLGRAVVAAAVARILQQGKVPVYWPDSLANVNSYRLAYAVGFQKVAEMLFCCYAQPEWSGFPLSV